jgi:DNA-binding response OmpR family regulator
MVAEAESDSVEEWSDMEDTMPNGGLPLLLLIDDDEADGALLEKYAGREYRIYRASTFSEAHSAMADHDFTAVLLDLRLRGVSTEWTTTLGRLRSGTTAPIVVWSGMDEVEDGPLNALILQAGADEAVSKNAADIGPRLLRALARVRARATRDERSVPRQLGALTEAVTRLVVAQERATQTLNTFMVETNTRLHAVETGLGRGVVSVWKSLPVSGKVVVSAVVTTSLFAFFVIIATPLLILAAQNGLDMSVFLPLVGKGGVQ